MKNVSGLASAMRTVESACEKGEITIIGEGGVPSPVELYKKCVAYINKQYNVDILNLVLAEEKKPCSCPCCDEGKSVDVALSKIVALVTIYLEDKMPHLCADAIEDIVEDIRRAYCNVVDGIDVEDYDLDICEDYIFDAFNDNIDTENYDEDYLDEVYSAIATLIDENCVTK